MVELSFIMVVSTGNMDITHIEDTNTSHSSADTNTLPPDSIDNSKLPINATERPENQANFDVQIQQLVTEAPGIFTEEDVQGIYQCSQIYQPP